MFLLVPAREYVGKYIATLKELPRLATAVAFATTLAQAADALPSWNEGKTKQSILAFVAKVTKAGSPDFVPPAERIATFDKAFVEANAKGWTVVSLKQDWKAILP